MRRITNRERRLIETALQAFCTGLATNEVDNGYVADSGASPETITEDLASFYRLLGRRLGADAARYARARYRAMVNDLARQLTGDHSRAERFVSKRSDMRIIHLPKSVRDNS